MNPTTDVFEQRVALAKKNDLPLIVDNTSGASKAGGSANR
jgi:O-acetylhomoserine/O-acetylserine sulfhydrylase-like pyridoxal-dependent enzyme